MGVAAVTATPAGLELARERLHVLRGAYFPTDVGDVLGVAGMYGEAVVVPVHLQEQRLLVAVVRDLVPEHPGRVGAPLVEVAGGDTYVAEFVDFPHSVFPH